jgi:hypothetical protein
MRKIEAVGVVIFVVNTVGICLFSQGLSPSKTIPEARKLDVVSRSNFLASAGGFIKVPAKGSFVRFINAQGRVSNDKIIEVANDMRLTFRLPILVENGNVGMDGIVLVEEAMKQPNTAAVLVIIDAPGKPLLLLAPEARWAIMNVAALSTKKDNEDIISERVRKQLWRSYGYLMGCANSMTDQCVMKPVFKPEDLDELKFSTLGVEAIHKIQQQAKVYGITPERISTYRKACEEGWAPTPTNAIQKAVWEDVKAKKAANPKPAATK